MKAFYYHTTYFPVQYEERNGFGDGAGTVYPETEPLAESLLESSDYGEHLALMGNDGWELINVQPLLRGVHESDISASGGYGFGYSLTAGFYLFWKKEYEKPANEEKDSW